MKKIFLIALFLYCVPCLSASHAAVYKYVDKDGIVSFADDLQTVPQKYRASAVIVQGESKDEEAKQPAAAVAAHENSSSVNTADTAATREPETRRPLSSRLLISAAVTMAAGLIFIVISRQREIKGNKKLLSFIRNSMLAAVSLYLVVAHAGDLLTIFGFAGKAVDNARQQSAEKGKKAAQAVKQLDALFEQVQQAQQAEEAQAKPPAGDKDR